MSDSKNSKLKEFIFGTQNIGSLIPGFLLGIVVMLVSIILTKWLGELLPYEKNPLSVVLVAIIVGLLLRNLIRLPASFEPGIKFGIKKLLRFGIILMGIRLSVFAVIKIGALAVGLVVVCIAAALFITISIANRLGVSEKLATLIAAGTSICGVSAIVATAPVIEAKEEEIAYAVGTITIFGLLATILYPYLVELVLHLSVAQAGFFLGTAVHDTSQVTATALIYDQLWGLRTGSGFSGADIAITTKLVRNTFMAFVIPFLGYWSRKRNNVADPGVKVSIMKYVPFFVFGYICMGIIRSVGDFAFGAEAEAWYSVWHFIKTAAVYVIATAIACVGLNTNIKKMIKLSYKPFVTGLIAAVSVGLVSFGLVTLFAKYLHF